jgi:chemotaxis protein MotA
MLDKKDLTIFTQAFISSTVFSIVANVATKLIEGKGFDIAERLLLLVGGDFFSGGYIQWITYFAFVWAILDMKRLRKRVVAETSYFKANLLPKSEKHMIMANDVYDIHQQIREFEKKHAKTLLTQLIKNACAKFRSTKNISEVLDVINIMTDLHRDSSEMEQTNIRYLLWAIPSLGFIGTVLGISQALMIANNKDMKAITSTLGVAFDTTLVALILSIILMWLFHDLQKLTDSFHVKSKEYVIENFINKIEI